MKIGVFDSGIGGLTVLKELIDNHPNHHYIYYGDSKNLPYGNKSKEELKVLTDNIIKFLINKKVDVIVIACGTVSSNIYDDIKDKYKVPIHDIINPTINYLNEKKLNDVGIIATTMTIKSGVFNKQDLFNVNNLMVKDCPEFVPIIENREQETNFCTEKIHEYLSFMKNSNIKSLVLGCTHYPLLSNEINEYFNKNINIINMGTIIAKQLDLKSQTNFKLELYFSNINETIQNNVSLIIGDFPIEKIE